MSSCAASCCTHCPKASSASATSASSPVGAAPLSLPLCFQLLGAVPQPQVEQQASDAKEPRRLWRCPQCGGPMVVIERLTAAQIQLRSPGSGSPHALVSK